MRSGAIEYNGSTIKYIEGIEDLNKQYKTTYERENGK